MANNRIGFTKMSDTELANYYVDLCVYQEEAAQAEKKIIQAEVMRRFINRFADVPEEEEDTEELQYDRFSAMRAVANGYKVILMDNGEEYGSLTGNLKE